MDSQTNLPKLYIVVPCYNEEAVLTETSKQLENLLLELIEKKTISHNSKILFVNDGSKDNTWNIIELLCKKSLYINGIKLSRNYGHQNALLAGLSVAQKYSTIIISIDADLQDDIHVISDMIDKYNSGCDVVYGVRKSRKTDTFFKRLTALSFYKIMSCLGVQTIYNHADYRLMTNRAVEELLKYPERNLFLRGIVPLLGYNTDIVYYDRAERFAGESKYPLSKMFNFAIDGITSFSVKPVRLILSLGLIFILISVLILIYALHAFFTKDSTPGWTSLILSLWFIGGCILVSIGIIGEYIGKIYIEVKNRPRYNIEKILN